MICNWNIFEPNRDVNVYGNNQRYYVTKSTPAKYDMKTLMVGRLFILQWKFLSSEIAIYFLVHNFLLNIPPSRYKISL